MTEKYFKIELRLHKLEISITDDVEFQIFWKVRDFKSGKPLKKSSRRFFRERFSDFSLRWVVPAVDPALIVPADYMTEIFLLVMKTGSEKKKMAGRCELNASVFLRNLNQPMRQRFHLTNCPDSLAFLEFQVIVTEESCPDISPNTSFSNISGISNLIVDGPSEEVKLKAISTNLEEKKILSDRKSPDKSKAASKVEIGELGEPKAIQNPPLGSNLNSSARKDLLKTSEDKALKKQPEHPVKDGNLRESSSKFSPHSRPEKQLPVDPNFDPFDVTHNVLNQIIPEAQKKPPSGNQRLESPKATQIDPPSLDPSHPKSGPRQQPPESNKKFMDQIFESGKDSLAFSKKEKANFVFDSTPGGEIADKQSFQAPPGHSGLSSIEAISNPENAEVPNLDESISKMSFSNRPSFQEERQSITFSKIPNMRESNFTFAANRPDPLGPDETVKKAMSSVANIELMKDMRAKIEELEVQNSILKSEVQKLSFQKKNGETTPEVDFETQMKLLDLKEAKESLHAETKKLESTIDGLKEENRVIRFEKEVKAKEILVLKMAVMELRQKFSASAEKQRLNGTLNESNDDEREELRAANKKLVVELQTLTHQFEEFKQSAGNGKSLADSSAGESGAKIQALGKRNEELERQVEQLTSENRHLLEEKESLKNVNISVLDEIKEMKDSMNRSQASRFASMIKEKAELRKQLEEARKESVYFKSTVENLNNTIENLQLQIKKLEDQSQSGSNAEDRLVLMSQISQLKIQILEMEQSKGENALLQSRVKQLESASKELFEVKNENKRLKSEFTELDTLKAENIRLRAQDRSKTETISSLQKRSEHSETQSLRIQTLSKRVEELEKDKSQSERLLSAAEIQASLNKQKMARILDFLIGSGRNLKREELQNRLLEIISE